MKKYALFFSILSLMLLGFNVNSVNAQSASGCIAGDNFSRTTGQACATTTVTADCQAGDVFSSVTGQACTSTTTVQQDNSSKLFAQFADLFLTNSRESFTNIARVKLLQQFLKDQGYYFGKIDGKYGKISARAASDYQADNGSVFKDSDSTPTPVQATYPDGCTSYQGYSMTTGEPCNGSFGNNQSPIISGVSGPQALYTNQQGTWTVTASDPSGGNLVYSVVWGDEVPQAHTQGLDMRYGSNSQQSATFTHTYSQARNYTPTFTVTNSNSGQDAHTSLNVSVRNTPPSIYSDGCNSNTGYSSTTGQFCGNPTPSTQLSVSITSPSSGANLPIGSSSFTAQVSGGSGSYKYNWDFGDGGGSHSNYFEGNSQTISHYYNNAGMYILISLSVTDSSGATAYAHKITVNVLGSTSTLPDGCASNTGYSMTTGLSCGNPIPITPTPVTPVTYGYQYLPTTQNVSGTGSLISASEDIVWKLVDPSNHMTDWKWQFYIQNSSNASKTVKRMVLVHNTGGEGWSTDDTANNPVNKGLYLLATRLVSSPSYYLLNSYTSSVNMTIPSGTNTSFYAYGYPGSWSFTGGTLVVEFTDGTGINISVPASSLTPTTVGTTPTPTNSAKLTVSQNTAYASQNVNPNSANVKIGSYTLQNSTGAEGVRVTQLTVNISGSVPLMNITSLRTSETSGSGSTPVMPTTSNVFSVNFTIPDGGSKTIDIYADIGNTTGRIQTFLGALGIGVVSNNSVSGSSVSGNSFADGQVITVSSTSLTASLVSSASTTGQYIAAGTTGVTNATTASYKFVSTNGSSTITEMKFNVTGPVTSISIGGQSGPVAGSTIYITGLNIAVPSGSTGVTVPVTVSYGSIGPAGIGAATSGTTSSIALTSASYLSGSGVVATITPYISSPTMMLVGAKPVLSVTTTNSAGLISGGEAHLFDVTIAPTAGIKIKTLQFALVESGISGSPTLSNVRITDGSANITDFGTAGVCSLASGVWSGGMDTVTCTDSAGYTLSSLKTFSIYGTVGGTFATSPGTTVSAKLDTADTFSWVDLTGGATSAQTTNNLTYLYNYPVGTWSTYNSSVGYNPNSLLPASAYSALYSFPAGCTSTKGYSITTGKLCSGR